MSNQKFFSNADITKYYLEELLSDGKEHEASEIADYILAKTDGKGIGGYEITHSMISAAIRESVTSPDSRCRNTRRAVYQQKEYDADSILDNMARVIEKAKKDFDKSCIIDIVKCSISDEELIETQNAVKQVKDLLEQAAEVIQSTKTDL